jgi:hypothetical protein
MQLEWISVLTSHNFWKQGWSRQELLLLKELLPYEVKPLDDGFKYLEFFLKPNCYLINEWRWLLKIVEIKISNGYILGGRYILVKSVLESIYMYWLYLENIVGCGA